MNEKTEDFSVLFYGNFIPLQGVQYIIRAAKILEQYPDIKFLIIGNGQTHAEMTKLAEELKIKNVSFLPKIMPDKIAEFIRKADICLGIFGDTDKTKRVIPNKVYEAIAIDKPVITSDTPAIKELFTDRKNLLLCKTADHEDLAEKILELRSNGELRGSIARHGYKIYVEHASPNVIGRCLLKDLAAFRIRSEKATNN